MYEADGEINISDVGFILVVSDSIVYKNEWLKWRSITAAWVAAVAVLVQSRRRLRADGKERNPQAAVSDQDTAKTEC